jgi:hypothetical protein
MSYSILRLSRKTPVFVLTVQGVVNPLVPIRYTVYRIVGYLRTKYRGMISSVHIIVMCISFRRSSLDLFQILIIIIRL